MIVINRTINSFDLINHNSERRRNFHLLLWRKNFLYGRKNVKRTNQTRKNQKFEEFL